MTFVRLFQFKDARMRLRSFFLSSVALIAAITSSTAYAATKVTTTRITTIRGEIVINGCEIDVGKITLIAKPITSVGISELRTTKRVRPRPRPRQVRASFRVSTRSRQIPFTLRDVAKGTLYRLFIGLPQKSCGRVFWRGSAEGLVAGGTRGVKIEGFSARTEVEIFDPRTDSWVGSDHVDFMDDFSAVRTLRWRSNLPGVQSAELQVSVAPFPLSGNFGPCDETERAVVHRQILPVVGREDWQVVPNIDFKRILVPSRTGGSSNVDQEAFQRLVAGAPFYIRVLPVSNNRLACNLLSDGVHGWVMAAKLPGIIELPSPPPTPASELEAVSGQRYLPPRIDGGLSTGHPTYGEVAYKVTHAHLLPPKKCFSGVMTKKEFNYYFFNDPLGCILVNSGAIKPGTVLLPGKWFWFTPQKSSGGSSNPLVTFGNSLESLGTGLYGALGAAVNTLHAITQEIESTVVNIITDVITAVDFLDGCSALKNAGLSCKSLVKIGLKVGLTSLGAPPISIPNWEQIENQGFDYLAGAIANEIATTTGIPAELTQDKLKELAEAATKKAIEEIGEKRKGSAPGYDWVIPYNGFDPAMLFIKLKNNSVDGLPSNMHFIRKETNLFLGGNTKIPHLFPATNEMIVPVVLPMNISSIPAPLCKTNRYSQTTCTPNPLLALPKCMVELNDAKGFYHWHEWDCSSSSSPGIYFRNQWIDALRSGPACVNLWSMLFTATGGLYIPFPSPPLVEFARLNANQWFTWNGPVYFAPGCP